MRVLIDYAGQTLRLTDERMEHLLEHPEMRSLVAALDETVQTPEVVVRSSSDPQVRLYYRTFETAEMGTKLLCVVVKLVVDDAFVVTAYVTDKVKAGTLVWKRD